MNAVATIIIRSRKMQLLFEGDCHQRYAHIGLHHCLHVLQCERGEPSGQSILLRQHCVWAPHLQNSVDSAEV